MDHRILESGDLDLFDHADYQTRPADLLPGLETAVGAIGEVRKSRSPLGLGYRKSGEYPPR